MTIETRDEARSQEMNIEIEGRGRSLQLTPEQEEARFSGEYATRVVDNTLAASRGVTYQG